MAPDNDGRRIVEQRTGRNTGDTLYRTRDGRWWHTVYTREEKTGQVQGEVRNGRMEDAR